MTALPEPALPRVTAVMEATGIAHDFTGVDPATLKAAADRGELVHKLIELSHVSRVGVGRVPEHVAGYWAAFLQFRADTGHVPIYSELLVRHPTWRYIGHIDRVGFDNRSRRVLIDWKCVASLDEAAVEVQLSAYWMAYTTMFPQETIHECAAVQLRPDGRYRYYSVDHVVGSQIFKAALTTYHWRVKHGRIAPRIYG